MTGKIAWRAVHGVLLLDKPKGITSTAALARARRALQAAKGGHTGTLDPMASGLLPLCFGEATKFASDLLDADKGYEATIRLGEVTTTGDAEGETVERAAVNVTRDDIDRAVEALRGPIDQVPPMHSALKRDGKPLYEYARRGVTLEREARRVTIHRLDVVAFDDTTLAIAVDCSKGTYIRTLAEDLGRALGCGGHLIALRRVEVGSIAVADATTLEQFEAMTVEQREAALRPVDTLIAALPIVTVDASLAARFVDGQRLPLNDPVPRGRVRVYRGDDKGASLLGTALVADDGVMSPVRVVAQTPK